MAPSRWFWFTNRQCADEDKLQSEVRVSPSRLLHKGDDKEPLTNYIYNMTVMLASSTLSNFLLCESRERGEILTNLKLQKLLYYAQA